MQAITASHLRANIKRYLDLVEHDHETVIIPRSGEEDSGVVMISLKEYNSTKTTDYLLSSPTNRKRLLQSIAEIERGETNMVSLEELDQMIEQRVEDGD